MKITPHSDEEMVNTVDYALMKPGAYEFLVTSAEESVSKKGNEMIKLTITIFNEEGRERTVFDYLLNAMPHKLKNFASSTGMLNDYNNGVINAEDCVHKSGYCDIEIVAGSLKPDGTTYPARNVIANYIVSKENSSKKLDDDVLF